MALVVITAAKLLYTSGAIFFLVNCSAEAQAKGRQIEVRTLAVALAWPLVVFCVVILVSAKRGADGIRHPQWH